MLWHGDWPLVGRDGELDVIESVLSSDAPGLVLVGDAGVGKTRLLRETLSRLDAGGAVCERVSATEAASSIPFGAVSHLLPPRSRLKRDPATLFALVEKEFADRRGDGPVIVGIDDAHLLDDMSAGLLHQLATHGLVKALATVRGGELVSDALAALWKGGGSRIEVRPLPATAVDHLLDGAVPGPLDAISRRRLRRLADGNPLLLRELLADAVETGALRERQGIWRWHGTESGSPRLAELVSARLRALDPATRRVLETIACGEPVSLALLEQLAEPEALEAAERSGMAVPQRSGSRLALRLAHPLYGEALRASMPASRARAVFGQLADALVSGPLRRSDDALVAGVWQLRSGTIRHPGIVLAAARQAIDRFDIDLAERLARAVHNAGHGWEAAWLLARVLQYQARSQEAFDVLPPAPAEGGERLAMWAITRAGLLYWGLDRIDEAYETLQQVPEGSPRQDLAEATRSWILFYDGRCEAALEVSQSLLARPDASERARVWASMSGAAAAGMLGQLGVAVGIIDSGQSATEQSPWGGAQLGFGLCYALRAAGQLNKAAAVAAEHYQSAVASDARGMAGVWAGFKGVVAKSQGRMADADTSLREAIALMEESDQYNLVPMFLAELAGVRAMVADVPDARRWMAAADARTRASNRLYHAWVELDRAWVQAASGDLMTAGRTALAAADLARDTGQPTLEAVALYDCARLGDPHPVLPRLQELAERIGGAAPAFAAAARAIAGGDQAALDRLTDTFVESGHLLLAAEAATCAQRPRSAALRQECQGARTPLLESAMILAHRLTPREREVAALAVTMTSQEIAERLGLSVNTVNNNLARAFTKLDVHNRRELRAIMGDG